MPFDKEYFDLGRLDALSYKDTFVHRLDPRAKIVSVLAFIITLVSIPKYEVYGLLPFFIFPVLFFTLGNIPFVFILKKVIVVAPFAVLIGILNPVFDTHKVYFDSVAMSAGWLSLISIIIKFMLTISTALLLIATTSFPGICLALQKLGMPEIFTTQLLFLYRYIFVLAEEALRVVRARDMRSFGGKGKGVISFIGIVSLLLIRTIERAEKIYQAMLSRGFSGTIRITRQCRFRAADAAFVSITFVLLYFFRTHDIIDSIGRFALRGF